MSAINIITELLNKPSDTSALPYSSVTLDESLRTQFLSHAAVSKELLGQSLMLAITFMDVCVRKNPSACKAIICKGK